MTVAKRYFTLAVRFEASDAYSAQFGDYSRACVSQEREDAYESAYATRIVCTNDDQASIDRAIAALNTRMSRIVQTYYVPQTAEGLDTPTQQKRLGTEKYGYTSLRNAVRYCPEDGLIMERHCDGLDDWGGRTFTREECLGKDWL